MSPVPAPRTLDLITYTAPAGWKVEEKGGSIGRHVVVSRANTVDYCMIVIYSSTPASHDLNASFAAEWQGVALQTLAAVPTPVPTLRTVGDADAAIGSALSTASGRPAMGMLIVVDAGSSVVSILIVSPSPTVFQADRPAIDAMLKTMAVRRVNSQPAPAPPANDGRLLVPAPTRVMVMADLAGQWGRNDGINTTYVDRHTGAYAGTDSIHFTEKWVFTADGTVSLDFFGIQNGRKIVEKSSGRVTLSAAGILAIRMTNEQRYVLRGWLDASDMTVMTLNGPWYDGDIPASILTNPAQGTNLDQRWVRLRVAT